MRREIIETGTRFNSLVVIHEIEYHKGGRKFICQCDCGNKTEAFLNNMKSGTTQSCGCLAKMNAKNRQTKHGMFYHRLYTHWNAMMKRCYSEKSNSKRYKDRGIVVCNEWHNIENFINDMDANYKHGLTLDRIDNDGNYEPSNCKWSTMEEQSRNKCNNIFVELDGKNYLLKDLCKIKSLPYLTMRSRIKDGWNIKDAIRIPIGSKIKIEKLDTNDNAIETFNSLEEASAKTNISKSGISQALSGKYKTAGGFKWRKV